MVKRGPKAIPLGNTLLGIKTEMPQCPKHLDNTARKEWRRVAPILFEHGLLTELDTAALASYCQNYARWIDCEEIIAEEGLTFTTEKGYIGQRPEVGLANKCMTTIKDFCKEFGLTPNARGKMLLPDRPNKPEEGGFDF